MPAPVPPVNPAHPVPVPPRWTWRDHAPHVRAEPLVREWLAVQLGGEAAELALTRGTHGRPVLGGDQARFDVSWSHSGEGLLIALAEDADVGVDLERMRPRTRALDVARRYFTPRELDWLSGRAAGDRDHAFLRLWCAKEAVLKAQGRGIAFGLHRFELAEDDAGGLRLVSCDPALGAPGDWSLLEFAPQPGYRAALAWRPRNGAAILRAP